MRTIFIYLIFPFWALCICGCGTHSYRQPDPDVSVLRLRSSVEALCAISPARNSKNIASLDKAAQYISDQFKQCGMNPEIQCFGLKKEYKNVIASVGPVSGDRIIVGAHYDVCGNQPGADDNASGVAALLEVARFAKQQEKELQYRVDFVAYSLEEPPYFGTEGMGSYFHAKTLHDAKIKVRAMICFDMVGYFTDEEDSQRYPVIFLDWFYPDAGNYISVVGNYSSSSLANQVADQLETSKLPVESIKAPSWLTGVDFSDHRNYWKFDIPAVMITDTAFYRNANYHRKTDTPDTLNYESIKKVVTGICWYLLNQ